MSLPITLDIKEKKREPNIGLIVEPKQKRTIEDCRFKLQQWITLYSDYDVSWFQAMDEYLKELKELKQSLKE